MTHSSINHPATEDEYEAAIAEAYANSAGLYEKAYKLEAHADEWDDRAWVLEAELAQLRKALDSARSQVITLNPEFFKK